MTNESLEQETLAAVQAYCRKRTLRSYSFTAESPVEIDNTIEAFLEEGHCMVDLKVIRMGSYVLVVVLYE